jgi:hypothetical protein
MPGFISGHPLNERIVFMIFENCGSMYKYWMDYVTERAEDLANNEFKAEFEAIHDKGIKVTMAAIFPSTDIYSTYFQFHEGHIRQDYVQNSFIKYKLQEISSDMAMFYSSYVQNGKIKIDQFFLEVLVMGFMYTVLNGITTPELLKRKLEITIRHEFGHMLDFLKFIDCDQDEYRRMMDEDDRLYDEHWAYVREHNCDKYQEERLRRYYNIPCEAIANRLGGVNTDELIEIELKLAENKRNKKTIELREL